MSVSDGTLMLFTLVGIPLARGLLLAASSPYVALGAACEDDNRHDVRDDDDDDDDDEGEANHCANSSLDEKWCAVLVHDSGLGSTSFCSIHCSALSH